MGSRQFPGRADLQFGWLLMAGSCLPLQDPNRPFWTFAWPSRPRAPLHRRPARMWSAGNSSRQERVTSDLPPTHPPWLAGREHHFVARAKGSPSRRGVTQRHRPPGDLRAARLSVSASLPSVAVWRDPADVLQRRSVSNFNRAVSGKQMLPAERQPMAACGPATRRCAPPCARPKPGGRISFMSG